jgi:hypothetical protein
LVFERHGHCLRLGDFRSKLSSSSDKHVSFVLSSHSLYSQTYPTIVLEWVGKIMPSFAVAQFDIASLVGDTTARTRYNT